MIYCMNSIHSFISGETFFRGMIKQNKAEYISIVKETMKYIFVAAFTQDADKFE